MLSRLGTHWVLATPLSLLAGHSFPARLMLASPARPREIPPAHVSGAQAVLQTQALCAGQRSPNWPVSGHGVDMR